MSFYLDTSLLVAASTPEQHTSKAIRWLQAQTRELMFISPWVETEFASALALKALTRQISADDREIALTTFTRMLAGQVQYVIIEPHHFTSATALIVASRRGLRAGDALHLAISNYYSLALCTLDKKLLAAANELNLSVLAP